MNFLQKTYDREVVLQFLKNDFLSDFNNDFRPVLTRETSLLKEVNKLGYSSELGVSVFEAVCEETDRGKRVAITQDAFRMLKDTATRNALVIFFSPGISEWRLSLLTSTFDLDNRGRVISKVSNPRRYSYLLGPKAKTITPTQYLIKKGTVSDFSDLQKRFSVEVVNREFYNSVAELFTKLVGGKRRSGSSYVEYPGLLSIHNKVNQSLEHQDFAVRLIGRLVFCWFLREKHSIKGTPLIPSTILSYASSKHPMYYHQKLEPLFFEVLNKKTSNREQPFKENDFALVPYLNGGLFSPQKGEGGDYYEYDNSTHGGNAYIVDVPDTWLQEFTELLDRYNFTVDENTSYDADLSVDPEMLGRIFENLLAEINPDTGESARKSTGSFYTPRTVVEYMVDRSLIYYLEDKTSIETVKLEALVSYGQAEDIQSLLSSQESKHIIDALSELSILDPACGSGAFPIGILQKVVYILQQVDKHAKYWLDRQLRSVSPELRNHLEEQYKNQNYDYLRKLGVIRESIYGIDIQPVATEIARLRCFLTLIVEEEVHDESPNRGIQPLPNLDFKFVTANSLLSLPEDNEEKKIKGEAESMTLFEDQDDITELRKIRNEYFGATPEQRYQLQAEFSKVQKNMAIKSRDHFGTSTSKKYDALSRWEPFEHNMVNWFDPGWMFGQKEFDIVIANPPYLGEKGHKELFREIKQDGLKDFYMGRMDLFYFFFHLAVNLSKSGGITTFITTNYYPTASGAKKLRKDFHSRTQFKELANFNELKIFESALGQHNIITILQKTTSKGEAKIIFSHAKGLATADHLSDILSGKSLDTLYSLAPQNKVFDGENFYIRFTGDVSQTNNGIDELLNKIKFGNKKLIEVARVSVGLRSGIDRVSKSHLKYGVDVSVGDGVFVVDEAFRNSLPDNEQEIVKKLYKNSDIEKWFTEPTAENYVIYTKRKTNMSNYPNVESHVNRYKNLIEKIRASDGEPWYSLVRPRDTTLFTGEKIVSPQRSKLNKFAYSNGEYFGSSDIYYIKARSREYPLRYLLGLLNSKLYFFWLYYRGKRKGEMLELYQQPLSEIPIKLPTNEQQANITKVVDKILLAKQQNNHANISILENEIDRYVYELYCLTPEEIQTIESSIK